MKTIILSAVAVFLLIIPAFAEAKGSDALSHDEAIAIFASLSNGSMWQVSGEKNPVCNAEPRTNDLGTLEIKYYSGKDRGWISQQLLPKGNRLSSYITHCQTQCVPAVREGAPCYRQYVHELEILSKDRVRASTTALDTAGQEVVPPYIYEYLRR